MRSLVNALQDHDLIVLRVIGEWWELDLTGEDKEVCSQALADALSGLDMLQELQFLPPEEAAAFQDLVQAGGRLPIAAFVREHGEVRLMGPGRLEREEPWFDPANSAEALWYRGFLYRGFDETAEGMIEFFYLPDELLSQFPQLEKEAAVVRETAVTLLTPISEPDEPNAEAIDAVDDLATLLALAQQTALRAQQLDKLPQLLLNDDLHRRSLLINLAREMGMVRETAQGIRPTRTAVSWLQQSREAQLRALADAWSASSWNDLGHTPGLQSEGDNWQNDPILARTALLDALPQTTDWFPLPDLIAHLKSSDPDFQRPDANYDTWYIRDLETNAYLNGFKSWEQVEGRLIVFLVQGPLVWLGLAVTAVNQNIPGYRLTDRALEWLAGVEPAADEVRIPFIVQAEATILVPSNTGRYDRFQAARISEPYPVEPGKPFKYRLTPKSLARAKEEGITPERILEFLAIAGGTSIPPSTRRCIQRWAEKGVEGRLETAVVLRVRDVAILETLRTNPKTRPYLGEALGDLAVTINLQHREALREAVSQLGLLLDTDI